MFDMGIDKLVIVGILIGVIAGPARLREWRRALPRFVGRVHALYQQGRSQVVGELDELAPDWREYDPRQLDPRRILRDLGEEAARATAPAPEGAKSGPIAGVRAGEEASDDHRRDRPDDTTDGVGGDVQEGDHPGDAEQ